MKDIEFKDQKSIWPFLKRIYTYAFKHESKLLFSLLAFAGIVGFGDAAYPYIFSKFITECISGNTNIESASLWDLFRSVCMQKYFYYLLGLGVLISACVMSFVYITGKIGERVIYHLRAEMFEKLQNLPFSYFDKNSSGWLLSRISSDTDRVSEVISWGLIGIAWAIVSIIFSFSVMLYRHHIMASFVILSIPIMLIASIKIRALILKYSRESRRVNSEMIGLINEHIYGVELNKILANEDKSTGIFAAKAREYQKSAYRSAFYSASYYPIVIVIGNMAAAIVLAYGSHDILGQVSALTIGVLSSFFIYAIQIFEPIGDITNYYSIAQNSLSAGERIFNLIDEPIEQIENRENKYDTIKGKVELRDIDFGYNQEKKILENFSLTIPAGQQLAFVGPTGEGKSTIASIIARFYKPQKGEIRIDDIDVNENTLESFRNQVGVVLQQPHVFSGTIADNIRYGNVDITDEAIREIFREMGCEDMASRLEEEIQPDGGNLSVGEKQLISIARVFAYNPRILILDEATSAIDTITEKRLQVAVQKVMKNRTSIVIAHRLSTIVQCDRILVIKDGKIQEDGSHLELMRQKGDYWKLHQVG